MMCWEAINDFSNKEPCKGPTNKEKKTVEMTEKSNHEEEHVEPTLNTDNRLKNSIEEFSWEKEDDGSTLYTQEAEQHELVYITNLKDGLQTMAQNCMMKKAQTIKNLQQKIGFLKRPP